MKVSPHASSLAASLLLLLVACSRNVEPAAFETPEADAGSEQGLTLDKEQREKIGLATSPAAESSFLGELPGFGVVQGHEAIAVASAEVATAQAAVRQSRAALARAQGLANTPGALPAEAAENAERQAAADATALTLAQRRLTALLGQGAPVNIDGAALLAELATGQVKLVRATFPLGALLDSLPRRLRLARLDASAGARNWAGTVIWDAPADTAIPGRSFFTLLRASDVGEGERLQVWASTGATNKGATVPASAVVQSNSAYWCYIEESEGSFMRVAVDISRPVNGGYFVSEGVAAGDAVVTAGAGLLLARETNPSTEAEE
jgi:hypothetical protein